MKKIITIIAFFILSTNIYSQQIIESQISGTWKVKQIVEKPSNPQFIPIIDSFKNATFSFNKNGTFALNTTFKTELFTMISDITNKMKWIFIPNEQSIFIGNEKEGYNIMAIFVQQLNGKILFKIMESELTLEMNLI